MDPAFAKSKLRRYSRFPNRPEDCQPLKAAKSAVVVETAPQGDAPEPRLTPCKGKPMKRALEIDEGDTIPISTPHRKARKRLTTCEDGVSVNKLESLATQAIPVFDASIAAFADARALEAVDMPDFAVTAAAPLAPIVAGPVSLNSAILMLGKGSDPHIMDYSSQLCVLSNNQSDCSPEYWNSVAAIFKDPRMPPPLASELARYDDVLNLKQEIDFARQENDDNKSNNWSEFDMYVEVPRTHNGHTTWRPDVDFRYKSKDDQKRTVLQVDTLVPAPSCLQSYASVFLMTVALVIDQRTARLRPRIVCDQ